MTLELKFDLKRDVGFTFADAVTRTVAKLAAANMRDVADLFPFTRGAYVVHHSIGDGWIAVTMIDTPTGQIPVVGAMETGELETLEAAILPFEPRSYADIYELLGDHWFGFRTFTYVGPFAEGHVSWPDIYAHLLAWLNQFVVPEVTSINRSRVLRAIPVPPQYDIAAISRSLWVLESPTAATQGTGFHLDGSGLVTCQHVVHPDTVAFRPDSPNVQYAIDVVAEDRDLDLAILRIDGDTQGSLYQGTAARLNQMDHIAVAGFPNYRLGDTGVIVPGLVTGFRPHSGVRRILTNALIIAGTSGGPVIDRDGLAVGIAVTGADTMVNVGTDETHGIIPIDALIGLRR